jgi:chitinase
MSVIVKCLLCCFLVLLCPALSIAQQPALFAYVGGYRGNQVQVNAIQAKKITHLLYAFADVYKNKAHLNFPASDDRNLRALNTLRKANPRIKILISVGGMGWSGNFSTMALKAETRDMFAASCADLVLKYGLDGLDIDWEFPGYAGAGGNLYRSADKKNFSLLFESLREAFNRLQQKTGKVYLLTTAVDGWASHFLPHTEMELVQKYVDYVLLMTYNFNTPQLVGGHFLYSPENWPADGSVDGAVQAFLTAGVPPGKLVVGAGFFPAAFTMRSKDISERTYLKRQDFRGGLARVNRLIDQNGFRKYWDDQGKAPFLFQAETRMRISYEDERSVAEKAQYIKEKGLAGMMYWDYFSDPGRKLLTVAADVLGNP